MKMNVVKGIKMLGKEDIIKMIKDMELPLNE